MSIIKLKKIRNFIGTPQFNGPPIFLNSMPKAGTNLVEQFLINIGYKRSRSRCFNESNVTKARMTPSAGRFYIGHLYDDTLVDDNLFRKIFVKRDLWSCLRSYVNYMYIDRSHPVSSYIVSANDISLIHNLFFTNENPINRSLIGEYSKYYLLDLSKYSLVINYDEFLDLERNLVSEIACFLRIPEHSVVENIRRSCSEDSYTKNSGKFDAFKKYNLDEINALKNKVHVCEANILNKKTLQ